MKVYAIRGADHRAILARRADIRLDRLGKVSNVLLGCCAVAFVATLVLATVSPGWAAVAACVAIALFGASALFGAAELFERSRWL